MKVFAYPVNKTFWKVLKCMKYVDILNSVALKLKIFVHLRREYIYTVTASCNNNNPSGYRAFLANMV